MPPIDALYQQYRSKGLEVALITFRESAALVEQTARERGYRAPVLIDESGDLTGRVYGVWGPPTIYLVDRRGQLLARSAGPQDWASGTARRFVETLLAAR